MPEGDTVFAAALRLRRALKGYRLTRTDFRVPRYATLDLSGRDVEDVVARGKHLLFRVGSDTTIHTHFGMEGAWRVYRPGERWRGPTFQVRAVLETERAVAVGFRMKELDVVQRDEEQELVGHLGPDLLGPDWDAQEVVRRMSAHPDMTIGEAILDQRIVAGAGNVYKSEVCFLRGVDPATPVAGVDDLEGLVDLLHRLLFANRERGDQVTTGDTRPGRARWVYGRGAQPCKRCGSRIVRTVEPGYGGERVTYRCPACQPATADRSR